MIWVTKRLKVSWEVGARHFIHGLTPIQIYPMGKPLLMWSAGADGQISKEMIDNRDKQFGISTDQLRDRRRIYGYQVPNIDLPKSVGELGRQWTSEGSDVPEKLKK